MKSRRIKIVSLTVLACFTLVACSSGSTATLKLDKVVMFNIPQTTILSGGWSTAERGGTWSDGKVATLSLSVDKAASKGVTLALSSFAFLAKGHESVQVDVLANTEKIATENYTKLGNSTVRNLVIPSQAFVSQPGHLQLTFMIKSPVSPKTLGLSTDARQLGIALVSIKLIKVN